MAEKDTVARPYAFAAFKQAQEEGQFDAWTGMLRFLLMVAADPDMAKIIDDPRISKPRLTELMLDVGKENLSETGKNFVRVLVDAGRVGVIREIFRLFEQELDRIGKRSRVEVTSAYQLTPAYQQNVKAAMSQRLGHEVEIFVSVDESLIGGIVIRVGDVVIDMSLRGRLTRLGLELS
jgi:F-type H+-transporting ATPase subunit delta